MANTTNLNIPLLDGSRPLLKEQFNDALQVIDANALPAIHASSKAHWSMWQASTAYGKQSVFRTTTIPSWGFWEVTTAGTSGTTEPTGYGEGDTFTDGTAILTLRRLTLGGGGGSSGTTTQPSTATAWSASTVYAQNQLVSYSSSLYMCLVAHTSSSDFDVDYAKSYWKKIDSDQTVVGSANGYSQVTKLNVTAPKTVQITINKTKTFCLPPVEVLKFKSGTANVVVTECGFDNADASDFNADAAKVIFDGTMHLNISYSVPMSSPTSITDGTNTGYISESDEIDFSMYKAVEGVDVG